MNDNVHALFETRFRVDRDAVCLHVPNGDDWLYGDLLAQVSRAAGALADLGVKPGDRVVTQTEKTPQALALYLGCLKVGAVYVPLNTAYTAAEMEYFLSDAEPALLVCDPSQSVECAVPTETLDANGGWLLRGKAERRACIGNHGVSGGGRHRRHRLHVRHDGPSEGGDADSSEPREQCADTV